MINPKLSSLPYGKGNSWKRPQVHGELDVSAILRAVWKPQGAGEVAAWSITENAAHSASQAGTRRRGPCSVIETLTRVK